MEKLLFATFHLEQARKALQDSIHDANATEFILIMQALEKVAEPKNLIESLINAMEADKC